MEGVAMTATPRTLDFRPSYDSYALERLARKVAEALAPVFEANRWEWAGGVPSTVEIAFATHRLLQQAVDDEEGTLISEGGIAVYRNNDDELRVYLDLGHFMGAIAARAWT
jgi:hypothetical protein